MHEMLLFISFPQFREELLQTLLLVFQVVAKENLVAFLDQDVLVEGVQVVLDGGVPLAGHHLALHEAL